MVARDLKFLDSLKTSDKENFLPAVMKRSREKLWTFSQVDFQPSFIEPAVSSACKGLCQGVGSMEAYDRVAKVVAPKHQELRKEEGLLTLLMQKLNTDRDELKKVIDRLRDLNDELESLTKRKKELENSIEECSYKLERAEKMSLGGKEDRGTEAARYNLSIIKVSDSTYVRTLENAIQFGTLVLLENIGKEELGALSEPVLLMATFKQQGVEYRRLRENVMEYSSNFKLLLNGFQVEYYLEESDQVTKEPMSLVMLKQVDFMKICICFHYLPYLLQAQYYEERLRENFIEYSSNFKFLLNGFQVEYYLEEFDQVTKAPLTALQLTWIQTSAETEKMVVLLEKVTTEVSDAKEQLVGADEKEANEAAAIAQGIQEECEGDLAEAMTALDPPVSAPLALNLPNISFFKPMPDPPIPVKLAMESVKEGARAVEEHDRAANVVAPKHEQLREADGFPLHAAHSCAEASPEWSSPHPFAIRVCHPLATSCRSFEEAQSAQKKPVLLARVSPIPHPAARCQNANNDDRLRSAPCTVTERSGREGEKCSGSSSGGAGVTPSSHSSSHYTPSQRAREISGETQRAPGRAGTPLSLSLCDPSLAAAPKGTEEQRNEPAGRSGSYCC
uniref:LOW QUALITY PROTEIN: dynein heavy chain 3, axonemal-like n=1 Tax=Podarcis muralis TaxID=64176 RepID=UPI0010A00228|nr:LOW QUALITY PROTEIN: dynein heavy chain 3, axonemal-like [Podarcis muralis]